MEGVPLFLDGPPVKMMVNGTVAARFLPDGNLVAVVDANGYPVWMDGPPVEVITNGTLAVDSQTGYVLFEATHPPQTRLVPGTLTTLYMAVVF